MKRAELQALTPSFDWDRYLDGARRGARRRLQRHPAEVLPGARASSSRRAASPTQTYLRWHAGRRAARRYLSQRLRRARLRLLPHVPARRRRRSRRAGSAASRYVDRDLGEALGQEFVAQDLPAADEGRHRRMTPQIEQAMEKRHRGARLDDRRRRRRQALEQARTPWPTRSATRTTGATTRRSRSRADDFFGNVERAPRFEIAAPARQDRQAGRPRRVGHDRRRR